MTTLRKLSIGTQDLESLVIEPKWGIRIGIDFDSKTRNIEKVLVG